MILPPRVRMSSFLLPPYFPNCYPLSLLPPIFTLLPLLPPLNSLPPNQLPLSLTLSAPHIGKYMYNRECLHVLLHALTKLKCRLKLTFLTDHELCHSVYNVHGRGTDPGGGDIWSPIHISCLPLTRSHPIRPSFSWSGCVRERTIWFGGGGGGGRGWHFFGNKYSKKINIIWPQLS